MRARERERFLRMNYNEGELEIRDRLYKARKNAKYKIRITQEHYDKKRKFSDDDPPYDYYLAYFSDNPEEGTYVDTIYFSSPDDFQDIISLYEGLFYELFDISTGKRIGSGCLDPDSPVEEIRDNEGKTCGGVCKYCFWQGMLYDEVKDSFEGNYFCYNPDNNNNGE